MQQPKDRLKSAREKAGYKTPVEAARILKEINKNTLSSHENGNRAISRKAAATYGRLFDVDPGWILYGTGSMAHTIDDELSHLISLASDEQKDVLIRILRLYFVSKSSE